MDDLINAFSIDLFPKVGEAGLPGEPGDVALNIQGEFCWVPSRIAKYVGMANEARSEMESLQSLHEELGSELGDPEKPDEEVLYLREKLRKEIKAAQDRYETVRDAILRLAKASQKARIRS